MSTAIAYRLAKMQPNQTIEFTSNTSSRVANPLRPMMGFCLDTAGWDLTTNFIKVANAIKEASAKCERRYEVVSHSVVLDDLSKVNKRGRENGIAYGHITITVRRTA